MTRSRVAGICSPVLILFALAAPLDAQSLTRGSISGVVEDSTGAALASVRVAAREVSSGHSRAETTDRAGRFDLGYLPAGEYELRVEQVGYRPLLVHGLEIDAGVALRLPLVIARQAPPVEAIDSLHLPTGSLSAAQPGVYRTFGPLELRRLPPRRRDLTGAARMSSAASEELAVEGLPASLGGVLVDGVLVRPVPGIAGGSYGASFPLAAFQRAQLVGGLVDLEWAGVAGGGLNATTRRGSSDFAAEAFGTWSRTAMTPSGSADDPAGSLRGLQGGALVSGPIVRDTASFVAGVEFWSLDDPIARPFVADSFGRDVEQVARDRYGIFLGDSLATPSTRSDVVSLFGRFDWQLSADHYLTVGATGALLQAPASDFGDYNGIPGDPGEGSDVVATASLGSVLSDKLFQEVRLSFQNSSHEWFRGAPALTRLGRGLEIGRSGRHTGSFGRMEGMASGTWHLDLAPHRLKFGLSAGVASHDRDPMGGRWEEFRFAGPGELERGEGSYVGTTGAVPGTSFDIPRFGLFVQDTWSGVEGLDLTFGLRYDLERLPADDVQPNRPWFDRTFLVNADVPGSVATLSPRLGFVWDVGAQRRWLLHGSAGVFEGLSDPDHLAALLMDDGSIEVRRTVGGLTSWPAVRTDTASAHLAPSLTLLAPGYRPPRSVRGSFGVTRNLGAATAVRLSAVYRHTDFLPRLTDLNQMPAPIASDRFGGPVYGSPVLQGTGLAVQPGSNRRFDDFDVVTAINADGSSDYRALDLSLEHGASERLDLFASYTYSRTTDDWLSGGGPFAQSFPPLVGTPEQGSWLESTSSLDVPHRIAAGGEIRFPVAAGIRLGGLYRYGSGRPFTPGYGLAVDANADGHAGNEPAFVSGEITGIEPLLQDRDCLRRQVGALAERNSCRTDGTHSLDLRLGIGVGGAAGAAAELFVDALNLTGSSYSVPDVALYRVDPEGSLEVGPDGTVTVPLVANTNFGSPLTRFSAGRQLRIGLRVNH